MQGLELLHLYADIFCAIGGEFKSRLNKKSPVKNAVRAIAVVSWIA
jgi:hypothetical protein